MDKWDGYPFDRAALFDTLADATVSNPIVLTGDIHSNWVGRLLRDFDDERSQVVGTEFTCTSLTSGGDGEPQARQVSDMALSPVRFGRSGLASSIAKVARWLDAPDHLRAEQHHVES